MFVITSILENINPSCCWLNLLSNKCLLGDLWKHNKIDSFRSKYYQHKWYLSILLAIDFSVWNNDVMGRVLLVNRLQPSSHSSFFSVKPLSSFCCFNDNIIFVDFPKSLSFRVNSDNKEVDWNVRFLWNLFVFLHQRYVNLSFLSHTDLN